MHVVQFAEKALNGRLSTVRDNIAIALSALSLVGIKRIHQLQVAWQRKFNFHDCPERSTIDITANSNGVYALDYENYFDGKNRLMDVIDNLLDKQTFLEVQNFVLSSKVSWRYASGSVYQDDGDVQFFHPLYMAPNKSEHFDRICMPIVQKLDGFITLLRAKMNMSLRKDEVRKKGLHVDIEDAPQYYDVMKTSIFYFNTTNGPTYFEDGSKVDCVENRLITFPMGTKHCGSYASDSERRIVVNLNWF